MWPIMLDMSRDECRGVLRRLELETYSNIVSTFRAQGGLSDSKVRILTELRSVFHISQDRHRAESRRVANDEQLCTIAEVISGPNTGYEWNKEGRRSFPLLSRANAFTGFTGIANNAAEAASEVNSRLPHPSETARQSNEEQIISSQTVVMQDPDKINAEKRDLKRPISLTEQTHPIQITSAKKRIQIQQNQNQQQTHNLLHTNTRIQQLYHSHSKTQSRHRKAQTKKLNKTRGSMTKSTNQKLKQKQHQKQHLKLQQSDDNLNTPSTSSQFVNQMTSTPNNKGIVTSRLMHSYAITQNPILNVLTAETNLETNNFNIPPVSTANMIEGNLLQSPTGKSSTNQQIFVPQIATSKKDIATNLTKLSLNTSSSQPVTVVYANPFDDTSIIKEVRPILQKSQNSPNTTNIKSPESIQTTATATATLTTTTAPPATSNNSIQNIGQRQIKMIMPAAIVNNSMPIVNKKLTSVPSTNILHRSLSGAKMIHTEKITSTSGNKVNIHLQQKQIVPVSSSEIFSSSPTSIGSFQEVITVKGTGIIQNQIKNNNTATTTGKKVQIINQQILSHAHTNSPVKLPQGMHLKTLQSKGNVKIIAAPGGGKMIIKPSIVSATSPEMHSTKSLQQRISGITQIKTISTSPNNKVAIQKVQLMPLTKSGKNVILMQKFNNQALRGVTLTKDGNKMIMQNSNKILQQQQKLQENVPYQQQQQIKNQNVIVVGYSEQSDSKQQLTENEIFEKNVINEDTPVDIIPSPSSIQTTNVNENSDNSIKSDFHTTQLMKHLKPATTVQTGSGVVGVGRNKILNQSSTRPNLKDVKIIHKKLPTVNLVTSSGQGSSTDWEVELDEANKGKNVSGASDVSEQVQNDDEDDDVIEFHENPTIEYIDDQEQSQEIENETTTTTNQNVSETNNSNNNQIDIFSTAIADANINFDSYGQVVVEEHQKNNENSTNSPNGQIHEASQIQQDDVEALMFDMHGMDGSEEQNVISFEELIASGHIVTSEGMDTTETGDQFQISSQ